MFLMDKLLYIITLSLLMSSCGGLKYQMSTMESKDVNNQYMFQNEDLILDYTFWDYGGVMGISIENKTDDPVYISWKNSNFIFNGFSYNYYSNTKEVNLSSYGVYSSSSVSALVDHDYNPYTITPGEIDATEGRFERSTKGTITKERKVVQIPPRSYINAEVVGLGFPWIKMDEEIIRFSKSNTPLNVRSYIAYSKDKDTDSLKFIDNEFWLKSIEEFKASDRELKSSKNRFYTAKDNSGNNLIIAFLLTCGGFVLAAGLVLLALI